MSMSEYLDWQLEVIWDCRKVLRDTGSICYQVGNYVDNGIIHPLDILLHDKFIACGYKLRNRIIWQFGHGLHCKNRFSHRYETVMWYTKGQDYKFNLDNVRIPSLHPNKKHYKGPKKGQKSGNPDGKNPEDVWFIPNIHNNNSEKTAHPCQYPIELCNRLILALTDENDIVLDPFSGSGTTAVACKKLNRRYRGIELSKDYCDIAIKRLQKIPEGTRQFTFETEE